MMKGTSLGKPRWCGAAIGLVWLLGAVGCLAQSGGTGVPDDTYRSPPAAPPAGSGDPTPTSQPFRYELSRDAIVDVVVLAQQKPVAGALVVVHSRSDAPALGRTTLWQGYTQANGRARGKFMRRIDLNAFELTVHKPGYVGRYDNETLRRQAGVFAPASRVVLPTERLSSYTAMLVKAQVQP